MTIAVSSYRYRTRRCEEGLRVRWVELAREKPRFGYRRLQVPLQLRGEVVNHKRVHRVYREAGLSLRRRKRKHCVRVGPPQRNGTAANQEWALDFVHDAVACGRAIRVLSVVDAYTRECVALEVDTSFASRTVTRVLEAMVSERGQPEHSLRQRPRTDEPALSGLVRGTADRTAPHAGGKADTERPRREFSGKDAGRVPERELVREPVRCGAQDADRLCEVGIVRY
jgi:transposase InsO family protein